MFIIIYKGFLYAKYFMFIISDPHNKPVKLITIIILILQMKELHKAHLKKKKVTHLGSQSL